MKTQNTRYNHSFEGLHDDKDTKTPRFGTNASDHDLADESSLESTSAGIFAYITGLAALAVVTITGQFPWFLLTLTTAIAMISVYPKVRQKRLGAKIDTVNTYRGLMQN